MIARPRARRRAALAAAAAALLAGCGPGERAWDDRCDADLARIAKRTAAYPVREDFIDWDALRNPILAEPDAALKDAAVVHHEGVFHVFLGTGFYRTRDFRDYEVTSEPDLPVGGLGLASPDVTRVGDRWHLVFQAVSRDETDPNAGARVLQVTTSRDLVGWSAPRALAPDLLDPAVRNIDGALARHGGHFYFGWKRGQRFTVSRSLGPELDGGWQEARPVDGALRFGANPYSHDWAENYQFLRIGETWRMVATARAPGLPLHRHPYTGSHEPYLYTMDGSGDRLEHWTRWRCKHHLEVPREDWNTAMHANSAFLADWRTHDGHFYLFYAGSTDHEKFRRRGHGKIGIARSRDLVHWTTPGT